MNTTDTTNEYFLKLDPEMHRIKRQSTQHFADLIEKCPAFDDAEDAE